MNTQNRFKKVMSTILLTVVTHSSAFAEVGPGNGGGGFQYPNSKALLKKVSSELAADILRMDQKAFSKLPAGFSRDEFARLIREVKYRPDLYRTRKNADGEEEGLMFDYTDRYCETEACPNPIKAIIASGPFFDTYRALPMKQLREENFNDKTFKMTEKELRQRLLHEVGHLLGVGRASNGSDDENGDKFADRVLKVAETQYIRCDGNGWVADPIRPGSLAWHGFLFHRQSGQVALVRDRYIAGSQSYDKDGKLVAKTPPDIHSKSVYFMSYFDQMEKNGLQDKDSHFVAYPNPQNYFETERPSKVAITEKEITWIGEEFEFRHPHKSAYRINIDLEKRVGELVWESLVADGDKGTLLADTFKEVTSPMTCRAMTSFIQIQDLLTNK